ncbi:unnamed protein product [Microthlaspi erraticum]|uniref:DUF287 domain-containing protein n=1 Tax=Microthlaspi erraticum TaxID=1685480 RepID=A0A6D2L0Q9_9BRAS|nr:unnamed protein product [Microthlaspi erraticum]
MKGRKNIMPRLLAQVRNEFNKKWWDNDVEDDDVDNVIKALYGELGGVWRWKPSDWIREGIMVLDNVKAEKGFPRKRLLDSDDLSVKRPCHAYGMEGQSSDAGLGTIQSALQAMFDQFTVYQSGQITNRFDRLEYKVELLTNQVTSLESAVEKLRQGSSEDTADKEHDKSNEAVGGEGKEEEPAGAAKVKTLRSPNLLRFPEASNVPESSNVPDKVPEAAAPVSNDPFRTKSARIAAKKKNEMTENPKPTSNKAGRGRGRKKTK